MDEQQKAMLLWKLGPGDINKLLTGGNPIPEKKVRATEESWHDLKPMAEKNGEILMGVKIMDEVMEILRMGHIPEVMEDHWFMYCTDDTIRFFRSWSGECVFEAQYEKGSAEDGGYVITRLLVNLDCPDVPYMGPQAAGDLFMCLVSAEVGADCYRYWERFEDSLENGK